MVIESGSVSKGSGRRRDGGGRVGKCGWRKLIVVDVELGEVLLVLFLERSSICWSCEQLELLDISARGGWMVEFGVCRGWIKLRCYETWVEKFSS